MSSSLYAILVKDNLYVLCLYAIWAVYRERESLAERERDGERSFLCNGKYKYVISAMLKNTRYYPKTQIIPNIPKEIKKNVRSYSIRMQIN